MTLVQLAALAVGGAAALAYGVELHRRRRHPVPPGIQPGISVPWEEEFELYHNALSLCSMKARVCMAELGLPYRSHPVDLIETGSYGNIRPAFLAVNPGGTVPVLVHRGHPVYESHEQIRYAADHAPAGSPRLVPADPEGQAAMQRWVDRASITGDPMREGEKSAANAVPGLTVPLFAAMIERIATWKILEGLLFHFDKRRPLIFLLLKWRGLAGFAALAPVLRVHRNGRKLMARHLDDLERQLEQTGGPWILGEAFTLADVSWLVVFERLEQVDSLHLFLGEGQRPRCRAYWDALRARPSYAEAITAHGHPTIAYGTARLKQAKQQLPRLREALDGPLEAGGGEPAPSQA